MPKDSNEQKPQTVTYHISEEKINAQNEMFENTLKNVHALTVFTVKNYGRFGYMIKKLEEILDELKKQNKGSK